MARKKNAPLKKEPEEESEESGEWEYVDDDDEEDEDGEYEYEYEYEEVEEDEEEEEEPEEEAKEKPRPRVPDPHFLKRMAEADPRRALHHRRGGAPKFPARIKRQPPDFGRGAPLRTEYESDDNGMPWDEMEAKIRAGEYKPGPKDSWSAQMLYKLLKQGREV